MAWACYCQVLCLPQGQPQRSALTSPAAELHLQIYGQYPADGSTPSYLRSGHLNI